MLTQQATYSASALIDSRADCNILSYAVGEVLGKTPTHKCSNDLSKFLMGGDNKFRQMLHQDVYSGLVHVHEFLCC